MQSNSTILKQRVFLDVIDRIDAAGLLRRPLTEARAGVSAALKDVLARNRQAVSEVEFARLLDDICDDMLGFGPLERFLVRDDIADIMVNGFDNIFIEVNGRVQKTDVAFRDDEHLLNVCQRIVSLVGRRVDESSPICDARLKDGSRVNVVIPPLAIDGPVLTIRRFTKQRLTLDDMVGLGTLSQPMADLLKAVSRSRCNILVSGGTGSGKTTLLNALTGWIDAEERVVTCEDTAELQLQQPHVVRMETRPSNTEGLGEVTMFQLVRNCLRMRPDRIIVGEVRGPETLDLLQAMNTGHDGSMTTIHANNPRDGISRMENMVAMAGIEMPLKAVRSQIASAVNLIVQASRLQDGSRRMTSITEITGMEGDVISMQEIFRFQRVGLTPDNKIIGHFTGTGVRSNYTERFRLWGYDLPATIYEPIAAE